MRVKIAAAIAVATATLVGCTSGISQAPATVAPESAATVDQTPVTLQVSSFFTDREKGIVDAVLADFHAKYPWITVKHTGGQSTDTQIQAIRGNNAPDLVLYQQAEGVPALCSSGTFIPIQAYMDRDKISDDMFTAATKDYTTWNGKRCGLPMLSDVYALFYDKAALEQAGVTPPKTWAELTAAAEKLTVKNADGSLKRVGFMPLLDLQETNARTMTPGWNLSWFDSAGKSQMATDPNWAAMLKWQKELVNFYGQDALKKFRTKLGDEFSTSNSLYTGQTPMVLDGEWRVAFIEKEAAKLDYGVVPIPSLDPAKYGGGYISGTVLGIPAGSKHAEQAWLLMRYLATDTGAVSKLAEGLKNIPTTKDAMKDQTLRSDASFSTLMDIAANANSVTVPATLAGSAPGDLFTQNVGAWQWSSDADPTSFLQKISTQIDNQLAQSGTGK
jgi:multiple sugar transport system substrate-binding protein